MRTILIDSGPLYALFDTDDAYHKKTLKFLQTNTAILATTLTSITEVCYLLDFNKEAQLAFLDWIKKGAVQIKSIDSTDLHTILEFTQKYQDLPMDFADACLVALAIRLNITEIATVDGDFDIYRLPGKKRFKLYIKSSHSAS